MAGFSINIDLKGLMDQTVRDILIINIGTLWDDYCYRNNVKSDIKLEGVNFLEDFAKTINERTHKDT